MFGGERAQSEVLGTVLLLGLTVAVVGTTVALGGTALGDSQRTADLQRVEGAMTQMDSKASLVAHGESPSQRVSFGERRGTMSIDDDAGRMIVAENESGEEILNASLTALVYENDGTKVAYQGGGVWRSNGNHTSMVSQPEFHYRGETLTIPLITVANDSEVDSDRLTITANGTPKGHVERNPVVDDVTVTVTGDYHGGWASFFESRTDSRIVERGDNSVTVVLRTELIGNGVPQSLGVLGNSKFNLESIGSLSADSYDSAVAGPNDRTGNAVIAVGGSIDGPQGNGNQEEYITINGSLLAKDSIQPSPSGLKNGNHGIVTKNVTEGAEIDDPTPVDGYLFQAFSEYDDRYANESTVTYSDWTEVKDDEPVTEPATVGDDLEVDGTTESYRVEDAVLGVDNENDLSIEDGGSLTLEAAGGQAGFEFDDLEVESGELVLDTTDGDIDLFVDGGVSFGGESASPANLTVIGDGAVRLYARGDVSFRRDVNVDVGSGAELRLFHDDGDGDIDIGGEGDDDDPDDGGVSVTTGPNEPADAFWLFSNADEMEIDGSDDPVDITGTIYAPNAEVEDAEGAVTIRGALVVNSLGDSESDEDNDDNLSGLDLTIRYDEALATAEVFGEVERVPTITYLHVSTQDIRIESD
ncbi:DUF7289 family protein [Halorubrum tebenquichense]|uniref:DUF7305 domain-containing protein n=1 Tax=Halorubrum tebenquichense DSM 14210 TaxID=1227485 RepID=M0DLQ2_9EURY|nr:hypothetical protein [Halorubrum tebenquichense]ELZ35637.1 hypothetical protein C472_11439 [Halorubrum tebenquichense DSM 14210]